jgi:predicted AAA+ superfamily ATPase
MYPFTFKEIIKNNVLNADINSTLKQYLYYGGIGKVIPNYKNIENVKLLLKVVNEDSIQKDIFKRYRIKNKTEFLSIVKYIFDQVGKNISINNIATDFYQSKKIKYSYKTIADYLYKLENANLIISLPYYDLKGRKIIKSKQKYYSSDLGLLSINTTFQGNKS